MYELKKNGKVFTSKSVGTGPSSCENETWPRSHKGWETLAKGANVLELNLHLPSAPAMAYRGLTFTLT